MIRYTFFNEVGHQLGQDMTRLPVTPFRFGWGTLVLIRRAMIFSEMISFASDISPDIYPIAGVHPDGFAAYDSGRFGWLRGTRKARLYKLSSWTHDEVKEHIADIFRKAPYTWPREEQFQQIPDLLELSPEDCLFYENGEKEYSVEIAKVYDSGAELLLRYTVDGNNAGDGVEDIYQFRRLQTLDR